MIMNIDKRINKWAAPTGSTGRDACKAFVLMDIITAVCLYIILSILLVGELI